MSTRQITLKTVLWAILGVLATLTVARFLRGLGATTALTDAAPWGFWIAFDVMCGVALAAGGFVLAATVYIFGREDYRAFARPAILTAMLGYIAVAGGLFYDLGLPWRIWHPAIFPQPYSVLFEVAMCVMVYLGVLIFEFGPVILEHPWFKHRFFRAVHRLLKKVGIPLVIAGIVLSTLHQSSLGSLFLIAPYRLHPLWYSPIIWILFFISAVGLGLMMVTAESFFSAWLFGHRLKMKQLSGLGRAASIVLLLYAGVRLSDLAARGVLGSAFDGSWQGVLFVIELSVSALLPAFLLLFKRIRLSPAGLAACSGMTIFGMIGYRFDVCIVAFARPEGMPYFPSWMEIAVSLGIVAGAMLVFIFFVERLKVYPEEHQDRPDRPSFEPEAARVLLPNSLAIPRRYSLAAIVAAVVAIALLPRESLFGAQLKQTPVQAPRTLAGWMQPRSEKPGHRIGLVESSSTFPADAQEVSLLLIDGNRDGRLVLFPHDRHAEKLGADTSCGQCHHLNMPFDQNSSCHECHRDMYIASDTFRHSSHVDKLGGNRGCTRCHLDPDKPKTRETAEGCLACHSDMLSANSAVEPKSCQMTGIAVGYMDAMHGLCIECHQQKLAAEPENLGSDFAECARCHRDSDVFRPHQMEPYSSSVSVR